MTTTPILEHSYLKSWPTHPEGEQVDYIPQDQALTQNFSVDAHTTQYSHPELPRRLSTEAITSFPIRMHWVIFDVDGPNHEATDKWWENEKHKLRFLFKNDFPGGFAARGTGGYKLYYRPHEPIILNTEEDAFRWTMLYHAWCGELKRRQVIIADTACSDWTRLFRLPHATRKGHLLQLETVGDPRQLGIFDTGHRLADFNVTPAKFESIGDYTGNGFLFDLFNKQGWVVKELRPGCWAVKCPWESEHSKPETKFDGSTVIFAPKEGKPGGIFGRFFCNHTACKHRRKQEDFF